MKIRALILIAFLLTAFTIAREAGLLRLEYFRESRASFLNIANRSERAFPNVQRVTLLQDREGEKPSIKEETHLYVMLGEAVFDTDVLRKMPIYKVGPERLYIPYEFVLNGHRYDGGIAGIVRDGSTLGFRSLCGSRNSAEKSLIRAILDKHQVRSNVPIEDLRK